MDLTSKLKNIMLPIIFSLSIPLFLKAQSEEKINFVDSIKNATPIVNQSENKYYKKKNALVLLTTYDSKGVLNDAEKLFEKEFQDLKVYETKIKRINSIPEIINSIKEYSKNEKIDALILAFHGEKYAFMVNKYQCIDTSNVNKTFSDLKEFFSKDAITILYSCSTGHGDDNLAKRISDVLDRDVVAPIYDLISENSLEPYERIGEFEIDKTGRVNFNYTNFKKFFSPIRMITDFSMGTFSHHSFRGKQIIGEYGEDYFFFSDKNPEK